MICCYVCGCVFISISLTTPVQFDNTFPPTQALRWVFPFFSFPWPRPPPYWWDMCGVLYWRCSYFWWCWASFFPKFSSKICCLAYIIRAEGTIAKLTLWWITLIPAESLVLELPISIVHQEKDHHQTLHVADVASVDDTVLLHNHIVMVVVV